MEIKLPGEKTKKIRMETRKLKDLDNPQAITLSRLLGKLNHATHAGNPTCSPILPQPTVLPTRSPGGRQPKLFDTGQTNTEMHRGTGLVGETPDQLERAMSDLTKTITNDGDRCINHRLGSYMRGSPDRGTLVRDRESLAHKLPKTYSSNSGCQVLCQRECCDPSKNGQHHCNSLHQQTERDSLPRTESPDQGPMAMVPGQEYYSSSNTFGRCSECDSRRRIKGNEGQNRLEALPRHFCPNQPTVWSCRVGSFVVVCYLCICFLK